LEDEEAWANGALAGSFLNSNVKELGPETSEPVGVGAIHLYPGELSRRLPVHMRRIRAGRE
jgi:hypothetical protein